MFMLAVSILALGVTPGTPRSLPGVHGVRPPTPPTYVGPPICIINTNLSAAEQSSAKRIARAVRETLGAATVIEHYAQITPKRLQEIGPAGVILSGQGTPWDQYAPAALRGVESVIIQARYPILGICGGHQLITLAFGGEVGRIRRLCPGVGYHGCWNESGYTRVSVVATDRILGESGARLSVFESHYDEVKRLPNGFMVTASNPTCRVQAMRHCALPVYGVQFHPERWDSAHPAGREVLRRFLLVCMSARNSRHAEQGRAAGNGKADRNRRRTKSAFAYEGGDYLPLRRGGADS